MVNPRRSRLRFFLFDNLERKFIELHDFFVCGRDEGDLCLAHDTAVSRKHCRFWIVANDIYVEDLGSTNKTKVNSVSLMPRKRRRLQLNDVIELGARRFVLTHQNKFPPSNIDDVRKPIPAFLAIRKEDGTLTSHISRIFTKQTRVLLDRKAYSRLRIREFMRLQGWDASTLAVLCALMALWCAAFVYSAWEGALSADLRHSPWAVALKFLLAATATTGALTLWHFLTVRKRFRALGARLAFVPVWIAASLLCVPVIEASTALVSDVNENLIVRNCVQSFAWRACRIYASENAPGYANLPPDMRQLVQSRLATEHVREALTERPDLGPRADSDGDPDTRTE